MIELLVNTLPVAVLGALVGLDMVSFPQAMLSRPLVSATLAGAFVGRPGGGLLTGAVLELIALETLPFGASRYAEWGTAGAVGGAIVASEPATSAGALCVGTFAALATAVFSSRSMVWLREWNARDARSMRVALDAGDPRAVNAVQLRGLAADLFRGFLVTFIALLVLYPLSHQILAVWHTDAALSRAVVTTVAATVALGAVWTISQRTARAGWLFILGLAVGTALVFFE